jgi:hypothetical protein
MKQLVFIGVAALTFACGGASTTHRDAAAPGGNSAGAAQAPGAGATARAADQPIELVGCLQGPAPAAQATGTSGTRGPGSGAPGGGTEGVNAAGASGARFTLMNATPASSAGAGIGGNGAGGSGGPLVSGRSTYDLDGIPAESAAQVNKQVRVTGRIDSNPATSAGAQDSPRREANSTALPSANRRVVVQSIQVVQESCAR